MEAGGTTEGAVVILKPGCWCPRPGGAGRVAVRWEERPGPGSVKVELTAVAGVGRERKTERTTPGCSV